MSTPKYATSVDSQAFRNVMGRFATGVTVIATNIDGEPYGMTANAITSVSLDPLLILVCVQKTAHMAEYLRRSGQFSVNILDEEQEDLSNYFAGMWPVEADPPSFTFEPWVAGPRLKNTIGALACKIEEFIEGGDHWIVTASVIDLYESESPANPLLYYRGRYRRLQQKKDSAQ